MSYILIKQWFRVHVNGQIRQRITKYLSKIRNNLIQNIRTQVEIKKVSMILMKIEY